MDSVEVQVPEGIEEEDIEEYCSFLDVLRESGSINMFGASVPLRDMYPELTRSQAREVTVYWMKTFGKRVSKS